MEKETPTPSRHVAHGLSRLLDEAKGPDERAAYLQDAEDLERQADDLEAQGIAQDALHLRMEAEQIRAEALPRYTVEYREGAELWAILEEGQPVAASTLEAKARALAHAANLYDVAGLGGAADVAALRRLYVEKLERQLSDIRDALHREGGAVAESIRVDGQIADLVQDVVADAQADAALSILTDNPADVARPLIGRLASEFRRVGLGEHATDLESYHRRADDLERFGGGD